MRNCNNSPCLQIAVFAVCSFLILFSCKTAKSANCTNCTNCKSTFNKMSEYRFTLQKYKRGTKLTCPNCGKKQSFVKYIDLENEISFPDHVGRCDHEVSCQYHYKPSDYFKDNPDILPQKDFELKKTITPKQLAPKPISFIDKGIVRRTLSNYNMNPMFKYLSGLFGNEETIRIFDIY